MIEWSYLPICFEDFHQPGAVVISKFPISAVELDDLPCDEAADLVISFNRRVRERLAIDGHAPAGQDAWRFFADGPPLV